MVGNHETLRDVAEFYGVPFHHIPVTKETKEAAEAELLGAGGLPRHRAGGAGPLHADPLPRPVRAAARGRHQHPPLLPAVLQGARPYAQAHERGVKLIGATAHYVTADLDEGPIIEQDVTRAGHEDSVSMLQAKGQDVERRVLAQAVRWHTEHRVLLNGHRTVVFA